MRGRNLEGWTDWVRGTGRGLRGSARTSSLVLGGGLEAEDQSRGRGSGARGCCVPFLGDTQNERGAEPQMPKV